MIFGSVCSGIESATVAWAPLGWQARYYAEIDPFACALLEGRYADVENYGDLTRAEAWPNAAVDVLVGGTPCQSFSIAGFRRGLADARGGLTLAYLAHASRTRPRWLVWENVPGVLSANGGRDFSTFIGGLVNIGYCVSWRVLDAQYFGLAQRRKRVFLVGHLGDWRRSAAVLFERASLQGHPAPSRSAGEVAPTLPARRTAGGGFGTDADCDGALVASTGEVAYCVNAGATQRLDLETETLIAFAEVADPVTPHGGRTYQHGGNNPRLSNVTAFHGVRARHQVRRLTPREAERLQGFPDDYTLITYRRKPAKDAPRYKALGNAIAVPVLRWIGARLAQVDALPEVL